MKLKVHAYINPRNGVPTCAAHIDAMERYRWDAYRGTAPITCKRCLKLEPKRKRKKP